MQFYEVIEKRVSIRKFKNSEVCKEKLGRMIEAAMRAPSWKNQTSYRFILVDECNLKDKLAEAIENSGNEAANSLKEAPMAAILVADPSASGKVDDKSIYLIDGAIAMEHFILAATAEGYGTCWIAAIDENTIKNVLNIPDKYKVVAMTPIGEIAEEEKHEEKKPMADFVFLNSFDRPYTNSK